MKLTKREIDRLTCPPGKRDAMFMDDEVKGFGLRVTERGSKVFLFQYRFAGRVRRMVLGPYGDLTPAQARKRAEEVRGLYLAGRDPAGEKKAHALAAAAEMERQTAQAAADALTLGVLITRWQDGALRDSSASYRKDAPASLRSSFAGLLDRPARSLTTMEIQAHLDDVALRYPVMARRLHACGRSMFGWAEKRNLVPGNPFSDVVMEGREASRERVLTDAEIAAVWNAAGAMPYPFGPFLRLLLLTLQRRNEVAGMRWAEISPDRSTWSLPGGRVKNSKGHIVHLSAPAQQILAELQSVADPDTGAASPYVFTSNGRSPISGFSKAKKRLDEVMAAQAAENGGKKPSALPEQDWRFHDLRRTGTTVMARLGVGHHIADKVLNHVEGAIKGVAAIYQRHDYLTERAAALDAWAAYVLKVAEKAGIEPPVSNVVPLRR